MSVFIPAGSGILTTAWSAPATTTLTMMCWGMIPVTTPSQSLWRDFVKAEPNFVPQTYSDGVTMDFGTANHDWNGQVLAINTWYHITMVVIPSSTTAQQILGYVNGELQVNANNSETFNAYTGLSVGNTTSLGYTYALNGNVRDVRIWTRALTATEVGQEMCSSMPVHDQGLLAWWPLDDDLYTDRSGNGHILVASGSPAPALQGGGPRGPRADYVGRSLTRF